MMPRKCVKMVGISIFVARVFLGRVLFVRPLGHRKARAGPGISDWSSQNLTGLAKPYKSKL